MFIAGSQGFGLEVDEQQRESHRQLRKNVMKRNREREMKTVHIERLSHDDTPVRTIAVFGLVAAVGSKDASAAAGSATFSHF
jgi:hypothetical protein